MAAGARCCSLGDPGPTFSPPRLGFCAQRHPTDGVQPSGISERGDKEVEFGFILKISYWNYCYIRIKLLSELTK